MAKFTTLLDAYQIKLETVENSLPVTVEMLSGILISRDRVALAFNDDTAKSSVDLTYLAELDTRIKKLVPKYQDVAQVHDLLNARSAPAIAWWWHLEWGKKHTRTSVILNGLTSLLAVLILGLVLDITPRFMVGGADTWGLVVIGLQGLISIFAANTLFNREGNGWVDIALKNTSLPARIMPVARSGLALLVVILLLLLRSYFPTWSRWDNNQGQVHLERGELQTAEIYFNRAIRLNNNNFQAHYNLGNLFETLGEYENARGEYTIAAKSGLDVAYNNLSRLLILQGEYGQAVQIIREGLNKAEEPAAQYYLNKNLGWARLMQERTEESITILHDALQQAQDAGLSGVESHCLLAQALDKQASSTDSQTEWYQCKALSSAEDLLKKPEMDDWQYMADEHLNQ